MAGGGFGVAAHCGNEKVLLKTKGVLPAGEGRAPTPGALLVGCVGSARPSLPDALEWPWARSVPRSGTWAGGPALEPGHGTGAVAVLGNFGIVKWLCSGQTLDGYAVVSGLLVQ